MPLCETHRLTSPVYHDLVRYLPLLVALLLAVPLSVASASEAAMGRAVVILDGSGSMWGRIGNKLEKVSAVRQALPGRVAALAGQVEFGLVAYGHRRRRDCRDVETLLPVGPIVADSFDAAVRHVLPRGKTPITTALQQAVEALGPARTGAAARIVLIADGAENCNLDPCAFATELAGRRPDIVVDVIGLAVAAKEEAALQCIAAPSKGSYRRVDDVATFTSAFASLFGSDGGAVATGGHAGSKAVETERKRPPGLYLSAALASDAEPLAEGLGWRVYRKGDRSLEGATPLLRDASAAPVLKLSPGSYHVEVRYGPLVAARDIEFAADAAQQETFSFDAGVISADARLAEGVAAGDDVVLTLYDASKGEPGPEAILAHRRKRDAVFHLAPGRYSLKARLGEAEARQDFELKAGERRSLPLQLGAGELALSARLAPAAAPLAEVSYTVYRRLEGAEPVYSEFLRTLDTAPKLVLPAGTYLVNAVADAASASVSVTLSAGESRALVLDLGAGVLTLSARLGAAGKAGSATPGSYAFAIEPLVPPAVDSILVEGGRRDALRPALPTGSARSRFVLPAGEYRVLTQFGNSNAVAETTLTLSAGEEKAFVAEVGGGQLQPALVVKAGETPLPGVFWSVFDGSGQQVASASRSHPLLLLRDGDYVLVADYRGKTYRQQVTVRAGESRKVELTAE